MSNEYWLVEQFDGNGDIIYTESFNDLIEAQKEFDRRKYNSPIPPKLRKVKLLQE